jgi:hypothetical protein
MKNLEPLSSKTSEITVFVTNRSLAISRHEARGFLSKESETVAEKSSRRGARSSGPVVFHDCSLVQKSSDQHIQCRLTDSVFAISEAEFRMDLFVGFFAKHRIANHGSLLKVHDIQVRSMSLPNHF